VKKRDELTPDLFGLLGPPTPTNSAVLRWPLREKLKRIVSELAKENTYLGTSSWKYKGWLGQLYSPERYLNKKGKPSKEKFEDNCLAEYAAVFKAVCVDSTFYRFPLRENLEVLGAQVPDDFQFGFKVTQTITIKQFPNIDKSGIKAGQINPHFLNAELFAASFLKPCEDIRPKVGVLMFEFSRFSPADYANVGAFIHDLDPFLTKLPPGWPYAIELRNKDWLVPEYFACLARHRVTHVFNAWEAMPTVSEQMALERSVTNPDLVAARFLLKPGRKYQKAVDAFEPYDRTHEVNEEARTAGKKLIREGTIATKKRKTLIFVNNRLEGSALNTIAAMVEQNPEAE
jgi:uncharacterized protein YecE (DUF72 family)